MQARVWGCRGSLAAPGPDTVRYGGNTSCIEVRLDRGPALVLDAGTGMRALGVAIEREPVDELHVLLTHLHLDHLQGLGFFRPLFRAGADVHLWGPASPEQSLADRIDIYLSPPLFPVRLADIPAQVTFHDAPGEAVTIGSATIRAGKVTHQGPTVGYRIEENGRTLVYIPDHEPSIGVHLPSQRSVPISGHDNADVLFHDAQYRDDEYAQTSAGVTRAPSTLWVSPTMRRPARWCSSTTTRTTRTQSSTPCSQRPAGAGTAPTNRSASPTKA
jgi:phosphoribosyl 1,2-cyclic phosphodiesterase